MVVGISPKWNAELRLTSNQRQMAGYLPWSSHARPVDSPLPPRPPRPARRRRDAVPTRRPIGAWSYRGDGALATETLKAGEGATIARSFAHDGLGRPVSIDEPALTQTIAYRKDGDAAKPYADGGIAAETVAYKAAGFPSGTIPPGSTTTYTYDGFGRLTTARSGSVRCLNVDAAYDGNGNLDSLAQAGASRAYDYHDGTNRLASVRRGQSLRA